MLVTISFISLVRVCTHVHAALAVSTMEQIEQRACWFVTIYM